MLKAVLISLLSILASPRAWGEAGIVGGPLDVTVASSSSTPIYVVAVADTASSSSNPNSGTISDYVKANKVYTSAASVNMAAAGTNNPLIFIVNLSTSGVTLYLYRVAFGVNVTNVMSNFQVRFNPTVTSSGTVLTPVSNNVGGGAPASAINTFTLPTLSTAGTLLYNYQAGQNANSVLGLEDFSVQLKPGNTLSVTGNPGSNNREANVTVTWVEQ
jgi:hypothetical protein